MRQLIKYFLVLFLILSLNSCNNSKLILTKDKNIEKIELKHPSTDSVVEITDEEEIEKITEMFRDISVKREDKSFQEKWNEMGKNSDDPVVIFYVIIYPVSKENYGFSVRKSDEGYLVAKFDGRKMRYGNIYSSTVDELRTYFEDEED